MLLINKIYWGKLKLHHHEQDINLQIKLKIIKFPIYKYRNTYKKLSWGIFNDSTNVFEEFTFLSLLIANNLPSLRLTIMWSRTIKTIKIIKIFLK